jgi:twinkle protein
MNVIPDTIDLSEYMGHHAVAGKVRQASSYIDDLRARFLPVEQRKRYPSMFSTKLRDVLQFRPGEVTIWAGYNGHMKSMFTGQLVLDLCVQHQRVLVASLEMMPSETLGRMAQQALANPVPRDSAIQAFSTWTNDRLWMFDHVGRIGGDHIAGLCRYFGEVLKGHTVVIDSMMMVCKSEEHSDEQKQFMTDTVRLAQELQQHIHIIAHCRKPSSGDDRPPTKYDIRGSAAISDQAHNVVTVWVNKPKALKLEKDANDVQAQAEPDYMVSVEKQRNGSFEGRVKLWIHEPSLRFMDDRISPVEPYALSIT